MLKLHHLNLLNEIHETALMLNLFEQRQLLREQHQLKMKVQQQQAHYLQFHNLPQNDTNNAVDTSETSSGRYNSKTKNSNWGASHVSDDDDDVTDEQQDPLIGRMDSQNSNTLSATAPTRKRCFEEDEEIGVAPINYKRQKD
jgi:hypothetical protein